MSFLDELKPEREYSNHIASQYCDEFKRRIQPILDEYNISKLILTYCYEGGYASLFTDLELANFLHNPKNYTLNALLFQINHQYSYDYLLKKSAYQELENELGCKNTTLFSAQMSKVDGVLVAAATDQNVPTSEALYLYDPNFVAHLRLFVREHCRDLVELISIDKIPYPSKGEAARKLWEHLAGVKKRTKFLISMVKPKKLVFHYKGKFFRLSQAEISCLKLIALHKSNKQIAHDLEISPRTVEFHVASIKSKTGCTDRADIFKMALENGLVNTFLSNIENTDES